MASEEIIIKLAGGTSSGGDNDSGNAAGSKGGAAAVATSIKMLGKLATIAGAVSVLSKASPAFQGSFKILEKAFFLTFKPLGDLLGRLLRPVLILLLRWVYEQLKYSRKNLAEGGSKIKEGFGEIKSGNIGDGFKKIIDGWLKQQLGALQSIPVLGILAVWGEKIGTWIAKNIINPLLYLFQKSGQVIVSVIGFVGKWIYENVVIPYLNLVLEINKKTVVYISQIGSWIYIYIVAPLIKFLSMIMTEILKINNIVFSWINQYIIRPIVNFFSRIMSVVVGLNKSIESWVKKYLIDPIISLFKKIADAIKSAWNAAKSLVSGEKSKSSSVDDAIITPKGEVITTNPRDYLIATKNPKGLFGSGGTTISNMNVSITVQELNNDLQLREIARRVSEQIQRQLSYRTAGGSY